MSRRSRSYKRYELWNLFKLVLSLAPGTHQSVTMFIGVSTGSRLDLGKFEYFLKGLSDYLVCVRVNQEL